MDITDTKIVQLPALLMFVVFQEFVFKKHIQLAHNMSSDQYTNNFGSSAVNLQLHTCKASQLWPPPLEMRNADNGEA